MVFYYLLSAVAVRWLLLDYFIFSQIVIPNMRRWNNLVVNKLLDCPYCNGCQTGYLIYLLFIFDWSLLGGNWFDYIKECLSFWLFGLTVGYVSLFSKVLLDDLLYKWEHRHE